MTKESAERRVKPRIEIDGVMTYHTGDSNNIHSGKLENLSYRGARIWIKQKLPATSQLHCRVESDNKEERAMEFRATLLHVIPERQNSLYGYGCTIEETDLLD
jgi:hypothetical protein